MNPSDISEVYRQATIKTAEDLRSIATSANMLPLSRLSLPEVERITEEVARVVPAGNVPGIILSGLARLEGRRVATTDAQKQISLLFKGVRQILDKAVYGAFFAGPAAVLFGYQQILRLAGKNVESAFPDGTWQFYLEFALREDSARHTNETVGFQQQLRQRKIRLSDGDTLAAWVLAAGFFLRQLPDLLGDVWREHTTIKIVYRVAAQFKLPDADHYQNLYTAWQRVCPYQLDAKAKQDDYPAYRRQAFETFLASALSGMPPEAIQFASVRLEEAEQKFLPAYQKQMTWLAFLEPDIYNEVRVPYPLEEAFIGIISAGRYYLLPITLFDDINALRAASAAILNARPSQPSAILDLALVNVRRDEQLALRATLDKPTLHELGLLRRAPIVINWDERDAQQPLAFVRQAQRGIGDHPLTIFRTPDSMIFDQSHIFFDGVWGAAVSEIMTNQAITTAAQLAKLRRVKPATSLPYSPALQASPALLGKTVQLTIAVETSAENTAVQLDAITRLRRLLQQRNDLIHLTVNDLLVLYRGLHAQNYIPSPDLRRSLESLAADSRLEAKHAYQLVSEQLARLKGKNPALLIPMDASRYDPRERIFPTTFRNPLTDFYEHHTRCLSALYAYNNAQADKRDAKFRAFHKAQLTYLSFLAGFGEVLALYRNVAMKGQSTSTASIRFLGHLPPSLQKLLDTIPGKFDVLNEIIKGEEVFSNMGRVAKGSTLSRFIAAKDDNEQKTLVWGVLTDDNGVMHLSLRDFRPHVAFLHRFKMDELAQQMTQDYLDAYASGLNQYMAELRDIVVASHETEKQR
jgi:hypothetical protein